MTWKGIVGLSFSPDDFDTYCHGLQWTAWRPQFIVLHNTAVPSLNQRPDGLTRQNIDNLVGYYRDQQRWSAGPHLFVDDKQIWVFTPLITPGVHSPSWNQVSLGVEMLGDYESEEFDSGRGQSVQNNAIAAMATLCAVIGLDPMRIVRHGSDPRTTHKNCPGHKVDIAAVDQQVAALMQQRHGGDHEPLTS